MKIAYNWFLIQKSSKGHKAIKTKSKLKLPLRVI